MRTRPAVILSRTMSVTLQSKTSEPSPRLRLWLAGTLFLCFLYFLPRLGDWNQNSRLDVSLAMVDHGTTAVDEYRWNAGWDVTFLHGHYYANKAPGQSLVAIPIVMAFNELLTVTGHRADVKRVAIHRYFKKLFFEFVLLQLLASILAVTIPSVVFFMIFFWFLGFFTSSISSRVVLTLATALGTNMFAYSQVFYPHVPTAALLFGAFMLLYIAGSPGARARAPRLAGNPDRTAMLAGFCLGGAILFDHTSAVPGAVVGLFGLVQLPRRSWPYFVLGTVPALAVTLAFNYLSYHNAAVTGYNAESGGVAGTQPGVVGAPTGSGFWGLSFSPYRGMFFLSPFLLLTFPGIWLWRRRGGLGWAVCAVAPVLYFIAISTVSFWHGGAAAGPRYLVPIVPFLALPVIFVLDAQHRSRARFAVYALMGLSGIIVWLESVAVRQFPPMKIQNPLFDYALPSLEHGHVALSMGSFVLAPFTGINSRWTLLPLGVVIGLWSAWCGWKASQSRQPAARGAGAGARSATAG